MTIINFDEALRLAITDFVAAADVATDPSAFYGTCGDEDDDGMSGPEARYYKARAALLAYVGIIQPEDDT